MRPPRIIIDGIPYPDLLRMDLDFGHIDDRAPGPRGPGGGFGGLGGIGGTGPGGIGSGGAGCVDG